RARWRDAAPAILQRSKRAARWRPWTLPPIEAAPGSHRTRPRLGTSSTAAVQRTAAMLCRDWRGCRSPPPSGRHRGEKWQVQRQATAGRTRVLSSPNSHAADARLQAPKLGVDSVTGDEGVSAYQFWRRTARVGARALIIR